MRKLILALVSTLVVITGVVKCQAQGRGDTADLRERQRQRQKAIEDPANNPFKIEPYEPLKPAKLPGASPLRATIELLVVGAADGDTLIISNTAGQHVRLRLQGIDAPDLGQPFYRDATDHLAKLASGKSVSVEFDPRGKPDEEGRIVAKVYLVGDDLGYSQVKAGFAWYCREYKKLLGESDRYTYAEAEKEARSASRGLWQEHSPRAPWDYRNH